MSQLELALEADVSSRHLSFVETGRAQPSRQLVLRIGDVMGIPLRERNELLIAAGFAPLYRETNLEDPVLPHARKALDFILRQQEPFPALVLDRHWNILLTNQGTNRIQRLFLDLKAASEIGAPNAMRLLFHPKGFRPYIVNWDSTAASLIQWLHRDALSGFGDAETEILLKELLSYVGVPHHWRNLDLEASAAPFLPIEFRKGEFNLRFFTTLTSLGTPHDITLQEIRLESFFPADEATESAVRFLATDGREGESVSDRG